MPLIDKIAQYIEKLAKRKENIEEEYSKSYYETHDELMEEDSPDSFVRPIGNPLPPASSYSSHGFAAIANTQYTSYMSNMIRNAASNAMSPSSYHSTGNANNNHVYINASRLFSYTRSYYDLTPIDQGNINLLFIDNSSSELNLIIDNIVRWKMPTNNSSKNGYGVHHSITSTKKNEAFHSFNDEPSMIIGEGEFFETKIWHELGNLHRINGPAMVSNFFEVYANNGMVDRLDGPAVIIKNSSVMQGPSISLNVKEQNIWVIKDKDVTEEMNNWANSNHINLDNLSEEDKILINMKWK